MVYVTCYQTPKHHQISFEDIIFGKVLPRDFDPQKADESATVTRRIKDIPGSTVYADGLIRKLEAFIESHRDIYESKREDLYHTFYIPKSSHGFRRIDAPNSVLSAALRELKSILEDDFKAMYHTSAFAYVPGRCTIDAVKRHQSNGSNWFLKTDFSNFFGNTTPAFLISILKMIYPFSDVCHKQEGLEALAKALDLCFLNGGLPQGTPISPMLTNIMMIPVDHMLYNTLVKEGFVYTRYADDILISHRQTFNFNEMVGRINAVLRAFNAPFSIKNEKTRYGSRAGSNWNLGVMLNKDNKITIGYKKKAQLRAMCHNLYCDTIAGNNWDKHDIMILQGQMSYYNMVEPDYMQKFFGDFRAHHDGNSILELIKRELG